MIMSIFDNFRTRASGVAQNAVKQTKAAASVGRIKLALSSEEDKMKKAYTELGRLYYRDYEAGTEAVAEDYQIWIDKIADAKAQIDRLTEEMAKVRAEAAEPVPAVPAEEPVPEIIDEETLEDVPVDEIVVEEIEEAGEAVEAVEETVEEAVSDAAEAAAPVVDNLYVDETGTEE